MNNNTILSEGQQFHSISLVPGIPQVPEKKVTNAGPCKAVLVSQTSVCLALLLCK